MTNDLAAFVQARLDEDEQTANAANTSPEMVTGIPRSYADAPVAIHISRWDPARVLAEVDAKRRIIDAHPITTSAINPGYGKTGAGFGCEVCHDWDGMTEGYGYCQTLRLLALPYADHASYRQEWAPDA